MSKKQLVIQHDLSKLSDEQLAQYLRDVSEFIGLDPDLNALDTIWMQNENGPGQSLVVYARRGTAEILRNKLGIEVSSLTQAVTQGSVVFTATGKDKSGRQEIAIGSKYLGQLQGKALDDAIMTASTRALRRLTMQFTSLGILDESEVGAIKGSTDNPASGAQLSGSPMVIPPALPSVPANNAPGRDITAPIGAETHRFLEKAIDGAVEKAMSTVENAPQLVNQVENIKEVYAEGAAALAARKTPQADIKPGTTAPAPAVTPVESTVTSPAQPDIPAAKPKRARKKANTVSMDGPEPEVVSQPSPAPAAPISMPVPVSTSVETAPKAETVPPQAYPAVPAQANSAPEANSGTASNANSTTFIGQPTPEQMGDYRKRVGVYTAELPSSENMGSVQKMRAFITRMSGAAPQFMTTDQWEETLVFFESFVAKNQMKGLVKYINDTLGVK